MKYYVMVEEWNYPTESGVNVFEATYMVDELKNALTVARLKCEVERDNFFENTKLDATPLNLIDEGKGYIITDKNGLEDFYYAVRLVEMNTIQ